MLEMTRDGLDQDRLLRPSRGTSDGPASASEQGRWQERAWLDGEPGLLCFVTGKGLWFEPQQVSLDRQSCGTVSQETCTGPHEMCCPSSCVWQEPAARLTSCCGNTPHLMVRASQPVPYLSSVCIHCPTARAADSSRGPGGHPRFTCSQTPHELASCAFHQEPHWQAFPQV